MIGEEAEALSEQMEDAVRFDPETAERNYRMNKRARVGSRIVCPSCEKSFRKGSYQQAFCSNKGRGNCKDFFWNRMTPERAERAKQWR